MSAQDFPGVTLAHVDPALLSCWEEMVKRGEECSLLVKHIKGQVIATLQCTSSSVTPSSSSAKRKKKSKGNKEKKLKGLLAYHQRLVVEKGLPPSRLMEQHAAASSVASGSPNQSSGGKLFQCDQCDFVTESQRGLKVHVGRSHKSSELPQQEKSRDSEKTARHLEASPLKDFREELPNEFTKPLEASPLKEVREDLCGDSGKEKKHEEQGKSNVSLNPEQRAIFGQMFKMYQTHNDPKS